VKKQVLFIQGGGKGVHDEWDNKLVDSLRRELGPAYDVRYPRMPREADPSYATWKSALAEEIADLDDGAILIGHSVGGTILINVLAESPPNRKFAGIFLIAAPFVGPGGWPSDDIKPAANLGALLPPEAPIHLYHGSKDDTAPVGHVDLSERAIPGALVHRLRGRNHQLNDDLAEVAAGVRALMRGRPERKVFAHPHRCSRLRRRRGRHRRFSFERYFRLGRRRSRSILYILVGRNSFSSAARSCGEKRRHWRLYFGSGVDLTVRSLKGLPYVQVKP